MRSYLHFIPLCSIAIEEALSYLSRHINFDNFSLVKVCTQMCIQILCYSSKIKYIVSFDTCQFFFVQKCLKGKESLP